MLPKPLAPPSQMLTDHYCQENSWGQSLKPFKQCCGEVHISMATSLPLPGLALPRGGNFVLPKQGAHTALALAGHCHEETHTAQIFPVLFPGAHWGKNLTLFL